MVINNTNITATLAKAEKQARALKIAQAYYSYDIKNTALDVYAEDWREQYQALKIECRKVKRMILDFLKNEGWYCEKGANIFKAFVEFTECVNCRYDLFLSVVA